MLKGYRNSRGLYTGILDKCPAVSYIDATVAEDIYGMEVKHREHYFSFDIGLYKNWTARAEIWLEDELEEEQRRTRGPSNKSIVDTLAPGLPDTGVNEECADSCSESENEEEGTERGTSSDTSLHHLSGTHSMKDRVSDSPPCACVSGSGENKSPAGSMRPLIADSGLQSGHSICTSIRKDMQRKGKGRKSEKPFRIDPLPGLLDHRDFIKVKVVSDHCDICHKDAAVFRCVEKQIGVCEGCYGKMVREWNDRNGIH
ncbi:MAG: hypothetical protein BWY93_02256 [Euryarchaeota archaeon ADurb.BinA087]|nr:MAG: hypothetical protein BWY93_02256 [Euryarchaeota archaeon ADurb.BinA087]